MNLFWSQTLLIADKWALFVEFIVDIHEWRIHLGFAWYPQVVKVSLGLGPATLVLGVSPTVMAQ